MKHQYFCEPQSGKFVHQIQGSVTFGYDLRFSHSRDHGKGFTEE